MNTTSTDLAARLAALETKVADISEKMERTAHLAAVRRGYEQALRGEGIPARKALAALRRKYKIAAK